MEMPTPSSPMRSALTRGDARSAGVGGGAGTGAVMAWFLVGIGQWAGAGRRRTGTVV
ncbi:hypothetical protein SAMN05428954_0684 [Streptomyces sp. 2112.3]|nr:hypothetical protein SAMN05428954_0684 [Streptomyces sp. 2112.3]